MQKKFLLAFLAITTLYILFTVINADDLSNQGDNPEYQKYIDEYEQQVFSTFEEELKSSTEGSSAGIKYPTNPDGTVGNFEGPQVHLEAIKFHNEYLREQNERLKHIDGVSAHFDPDHPYYGLPDVKISIQDVRLYEPETSAISGFLGMSNKNPKPYKTYRKLLIPDSVGASSKFFEMQLWLTKFSVTIDVRPDKDIPIRISQEEKERLSYPAYWYGSQQRQIKLKDLPEEHKDQRYSNLSFILKIIPDNSPIYVQTSSATTSKPDFAIGAIYCTRADIGNETDVQRISTNVHSGQPVFLNNRPEYDQMNRNLSGLSESMETNASTLLERRMQKDQFIWNKPYYVNLFFNNLGSWRSGIFNQNQFHDQVTYEFLMPIFVVGSWDVIAPQEILPEWNPPEPFIKKFSIKNFLPFWKLGLFGKIGSILILGLVLFLGARLVFR